MEKLRVGVVGVGSVVREIYQYLYFRSDFTPILDIVAVADPNDQFREWFCDTFNIPQNRRYRDYKEMFAQNELDAAQINTPDHIHPGPHSRRSDHCRPQGRPGRGRAQADRGHRQRHPRHDPGVPRDRPPARH